MRYCYPALKAAPDSILLIGQAILLLIPHYIELVKGLLQLLQRLNEALEFAIEFLNCGYGLIIHRHSPHFLPRHLAGLIYAL